MINQRLLLINTYYPPVGKGGAERSTKIIADALVMNGFDVHVLTSYNSDETIYNDGLTIHRNNSSNIYWLNESYQHRTYEKIIWHLIDSFGFNNRNEIKKMILRINPKVVITNSLIQFSSSILKDVYNLGIPIIHIIRDHYFICSKTTMYRKQENCLHPCLDCKILSLVKKQNSNKVDAVIGISQYILKRHLELGYFRNAKIKQVIPNPIDRLTKPSQDFAKKLGKRTVFGYVGNITDEKGIFELIDTFIEYNITNTLLIFGSGKEQIIRKLKDKIRNKENIKLIGFKTQDEIYKEIDFLIVPSRLQEAFGRVIIEGYSYGIPVIGSINGGINELIENQVTGYIFKDKKSLSEIISQNSYLEEKYLSLKRNSLKKSTEFESSLIIQRLTTVISEISAESNKEN